MRRTVPILYFLCTALVLLPAEVHFSGLHLSEQDTLLFSARSESPVYGSFDTLLYSDLSEGSMQQLSCFPEEVSLLQLGSRLQIRNRFGVFRSGESLSSFKAVADFPNFNQGDEIATGKLLDISSSPDGKYLVYYDPVSYAYGDLFLYDVDEKSSQRISSNVELSYEEPPALWSEGSQYFVYHKGGDLYYYSIEQQQGDRMIDESYRRIGAGDISSVVWADANELYYIRRNLVYRILGSEFFARSIYGEMLDIGTIVGKVPFTFNANFDSFVVSPDGKKLLYNRAGRSLFLYFLHTDDYLASEGIKSLPYLLLPRNTRVREIVWSTSDMITVLTDSIENGGSSSSLYRIDLSKESEVVNFRRIPGEHIRSMALSPDESQIALVKTDSVELKGYDEWKSLENYSHTGALHVLWPSDRTLIIAGSHYTEAVSLEDGGREILALSQAGTYGFDQEGRVENQLSDAAYRLSSSEKSYSWQKLDTASPLQAASTAGSDFRVYLETVSGTSYRNTVMVRKAAAYGTEALFPGPAKRYAPFPEEEEQALGIGFSHGSRIRRREVSLVFNAVDGSEGLTEALRVLDDYGIRSSFFVNGEFIRRNPGAVKELANSSHEVGNLFYVYFNMTDSRFKLDVEFIKRGLARNEDDYFDVTGQELSLLWHTPYYFVSSDIITAGQDMNYRYIGRDVDPLDWVPESDCSGEELYLSGREIVERIMKLKKPGSIVPIRLGELEDGRGDYLFQNLDLLINALLQEGYSIVPVTSLMEHAR